MPPLNRITGGAHRWSLCNANESVPQTCDWRGVAIDEPLFDTHMHTLESIVANRFVECANRSPKADGNQSAATMFLIPYPVTDIMVKFLPDAKAIAAANASALQADRDLQRYHESVKAYLSRSPEWRRCGGCDHVLVISRSSADYPQRCPWGCGDIDEGVYMLPRPAREPRAYGFRLDDAFWQNATILTQEQIPPAHAALLNVFPVARPTSMHPRTSAELLAWQREMASSRRDHFMTLAATAKGHRSHLIQACVSDNSTRCTFVDCKVKGACSSRMLYRIYARSTYCLMPHGDTPSRRAIFDALVCGCIPIVYHRYSFHWPWHVPDRAAAAILMPSPSTLFGVSSAKGSFDRATHTIGSFFDAVAGALGFVGGFVHAGEARSRKGGPLHGASRADVANATQTLQNAYARTLDVVLRRSASQVDAQRRHIIWKLLPNVVYNYGDLEAADAVTVAMRQIRVRIDQADRRNLARGGWHYF